MTRRGALLAGLSVLAAAGVHVLDRLGALPLVHESAPVRHAVLALDQAPVVLAWLVGAAALGRGTDALLETAPGGRRNLLLGLVLLGGEGALFALPELLGRYDAGVALVNEGLAVAIAVQASLAGLALLAGLAVCGGRPTLRVAPPVPAPRPRRPACAPRSLPVVLGRRRPPGRAPPARVPA